MDQLAHTSENTNGKRRRNEDSNVANTREKSAQGGQPDDVPQKGRKPRSRTCLQVMATSEKDKKVVDFNDNGQPIGDASVQFSSTMGVIVREQVSIVNASWHKVDNSDKETIWKLLLQKYLVDEYFKPSVMKQMGKLWRSWKCGLSTEIRKILESRSTNTERMSLIATLRPHDVSSGEWDTFVQERMSEKWQAKSFKMREIRSKQTLPHTLSRKGYARKEYEHNKEHPDKPLTKPQLWIEGHVSKKKTSEANAAKIDEIKTKMDNSTTGGDDILTQVLGKEYTGCMRGIGAGVAKVHSYAQSQKDLKYSKMEAKVKKMEALLSSKFGVNFEDDDDDESEDKQSNNQCNAKKSVSVSENQEATITPKSGQGNSYKLSVNDKCKLLNWNDNGEEVAKGFVSAVDPKSFVHGYLLGPSCYRIAIEEVMVEDVDLYRYEPEFGGLGDALGSSIAWPIEYIVLDDTS